MKNFSLTAWQRRRLRRQLREAGDERLRRRTEAVLAVAAGEPVASVAGRLGVTRRAVYTWVAAYSRSRDPTALADGVRPGRPRLLTEPERRLIGEVLRRPPADLGYISRERWTVWLLQFHLFHRLGRWPADETLRRELRRQGWVWGPSGYVRAEMCEKTSADPLVVSGR